MAEVLVMASDTANAGKDPGAYRADDVVYVADDGHSWGADELDSNRFVIISVTGSADAVRPTLHGPHLTGDGRRLLSPAKCKWDKPGKKFIDKDSGATVLAGATK